MRYVHELLGLMGVCRPRNLVQFRYRLVRHWECSNFHVEHRDT